MIRAAFIRRMAFAALACGFLDVRMPEIESEPDGDGWPWDGWVMTTDGRRLRYRDAGNGEIFVEGYLWPPSLA